MSFKERFWSSKYLRIFVIICGAILFYAMVTHFGVVWNALGFILGILAPIIIAAIITFLLNPIVMFFENKVFHKLKFKSGKYLHGFCVIFVMLVLCVLILLLLVLIIGQVAVSLKQLIENFDSYLQAFVNMLNKVMADKVNEINILGINLMELDTKGISEFMDEIMKWVTSHTDGIIGSAMSVGSNLLNTLITIMLTVYMLLDIRHLKRGISRFFRAVMSDTRYARFSDLCSKGGKIFLQYFGSNLLDSLIIGVMCYLFMLIMGLPYSLLIAVIVGVFNFVPTFGPLVGAIVCAFLILLVNPWGALWFVIYSMVSQFIDANLIKPKLFGDTTGLRPMWVLAAIIIGGGLFGVVGMLLGVPLFAIIAIIVNEKIDKSLEKRGYIQEAAGETVENEAEDSSGSSAQN